jgi:hypothetical protein
VFVALVIQHAKRIRRIVLSYGMYLGVQYYSTFSHKWRDFRKKNVTKHMCFDFIYNFRLKRLSFEEEFNEILL